VDRNVEAQISSNKLLNNSKLATGPAIGDASVMPTK